MGYRAMVRRGAAPPPSPLPIIATKHPVLLSIEHAQAALLLARCRRRHAIAKLPVYCRI
jgi:hypothetical protein